MVKIRKKKWAVPREGLEEVHGRLLAAGGAAGEAADAAVELEGSVNQRTADKLLRLIGKAEQAIFEAVTYASKATPGDALKRGAKRATPSGRGGRGADDRRSRVQKWLRDNDMMGDLAIRTPEQHAKLGYGNYPDAEFIIVSEGSFYMLMNGGYYTPEASRLVDEFSALLKSLGLWYDQDDPTTFIVMDESVS